MSRDEGISKGPGGTLGQEERGDTEGRPRGTAQEK